MTSKYPNDTNSTDSRRRGKRPIDYKVGISLGLIALVTWFTGRNGGGGACLAGACMKAALTQPSRSRSRPGEDVAFANRELPLAERSDAAATQDALSRGRRQ